MADPRGISVEQLQRKLRYWQSKFPEATEVGYKRSSKPLVNLIRAKYLSGQVLGVQTGALRASIRSIITKNRSGASMKVGTSHTSNKGFNYGRYWINRDRDWLNPAIRESLPRITKMVAQAIMEKYPKANI